jgi:predicted Rossmann fold nucleotide-binding protein DprA/Smf involved in DNA uptake
MRPDRDDPEHRPTAQQQLAGLSLFEPPPVNTRREAREAIAERVPRLRQAVLEALRKRPMTADEVAEAIGESILAVRPRVTELHNDGILYDSGERRVNLSGRPATVWAVKEGR